MGTILKIITKMANSHVGYIARLSLQKLGRLSLDFRCPIHRERGREVSFTNFEEFQKSIMGKDKKTHSKFHRYWTNVSWFQTGGTNFGSQVHWGEEYELFKNTKKAPMGKDSKKTHSKFHPD